MYTAGGRTTGGFSCFFEYLAGDDTLLLALTNIENAANPIIIANAIAKGEAIHAKEHSEDANRNVDGVVASQCLMSTLGFADALSHANVKWLAARAET